MPLSPALTALGDAEFVQLTTFRRSGDPVRTPVWVARDGDELVVTTPATSGKVKRLRHTNRVELVPSSRRGAVADDAVRVPAAGRLDPDPWAHTVVEARFAAKYGWQYRVAMVVGDGGPPLPADPRTRPPDHSDHRRLSGST